jgi:hypothetical protein
VRAFEVQIGQAVAIAVDLECVGIPSLKPQDDDLGRPGSGQRERVVLDLALDV